MHRDDERTRGHERDGCEIPDRIVRELFVETRINGVAAGNQHKGIAVGVRACRRFRTHDAVRARSVVDQDLLLEILREARADDAADVVVAAARRER
jgi:hypothetical protein